MTDLNGVLQEARAALIKIRACSIVGCEEGYGRPEKWADALFASHADVAAAIKSIDVALTDPAQGAVNPAAQFVMWCLMEGCWQGDDVDGGAAQDKAEALGLIVQTQYDPAKHGENPYCEPGDTWYVPSPELLAALGDTPPPSTGLPAPTPHAEVRESELAEWKQAARVEAGLRREFLEQVEAAREFVKRHPALTLIDLAEFEAFLKVPAAIDAAFAQQDRAGK